MGDHDCRKTPIKGDIAVIDFMVMALGDDAEALAGSLRAEHPKKMIMAAFRAGLALGFGQGFSGRNHNDIWAELLQDPDVLKGILVQALRKKLAPGTETLPIAKKETENQNGTN